MVDLVTIAPEEIVATLPLSMVKLLLAVVGEVAMVKAALVVVLAAVLVEILVAVEVVLLVKETEVETLEVAAAEQATLLDILVEMEDLLVIEMEAVLPMVEVAVVLL